MLAEYGPPTPSAHRFVGCRLLRGGGRSARVGLSAIRRAPTRSNHGSYSGRRTTCWKDKPASLVAPSRRTRPPEFTKDLTAVIA